ncbi:hypothetical protein ABMA28_003807 [Loxostege sticticalis]|uniref:Uncharacterized protein n=1 Tax=Loxostege sticticalis TaxID=481309 RepID=A0ABD0ST38_LOXSC
MKAVLHTIRILVIIQTIKHVRCQDGFSDQDLLRLQQIASNDGQVETITSYSTNIIQRDPNTQSISSVSVRYHMADPDKTDEYSRADRARPRKIYRIKNPFQRPEDEETRQQETETQDSGTGASNQYASVQYSLPPEEFLQQMRERENQYYQQQHLSTQASNLGYTATPQPQYQYSTAAPSSYDNNNQQQNQIPQLEPKMSQVPTYLTNSNPYQYGSSNTFGLDGIQSTPSPITSYVSTALPGSQFIGTPTNTYVSSSSPIYLSSPPNLQQYVSSPLSTLQAGTSDYGNNRVTSTIGSNSPSYDNDITKKMQIDHYDNSANGVRYINVQQYQNEYPSSTPAPSSSPYSDSVRENWQNSLQKSIQDMASQYQNNNHYNNQETNADNMNAETHRIGNMPSANNVFLNLIQPDYLMNNLKTRTREPEQESGQYTYYSHGDYGWKMPSKKPANSQETYTPGNYQRYQSIGIQSTESPVSQMNFQMDIGRHGYDQISKSSPETLDPQEFAKAAAKAHEKQVQQQQQQQHQQQQLQQQYYNHYPPNYNNNNYYGNVSPGSNSYGNNDKQRNRYIDNSNSNSYSYNSQAEVVSGSPYFYPNSKENNVDGKPKQPFDHDKALKNIVPIDVSNVVPNSDSQGKVAGIDNNNKFGLSSYGKEQPDYKQYYRSVTDAYYKDKNAIYGFNIKAKPDEYNIGNDNVKQAENIQQYYGKQQSQQDSLYNQALNDNKRYLEGTPQPANYASQSSNIYQDNMQASANVQQQGLQRPQNQINDIASILKLNDIPYRLTQGLSSDSLRFNNFDQVSLPTPLPMRLNQNVGSHQIDVANNILNKLLNKQQNHNLNRPEIDNQSGGLLSTINGFKVANPFNVDLKIVAEMLKGKPSIDDSHILSLRDQINKPLPLKLDVSHLQQLLLKNDNTGGYGVLNDGIGALASPYLEIYNSGRFPYQGVKYSRSQEEEESIIPIADASNTHPIGAVVEEGDIANVREASTGTDITAQDEDGISPAFVEDRPKNSFLPRSADRLRHPNALIPGRHSFQRKHPKSDVDEPYPLLKPPPPHSPRNRGARSKFEKHGRRRRVTKPKMVRVLKTEPLFEAGSDIENDEPALQTVLRPPSQIAEAKSDVDVDKLESS